MAALAALGVEGKVLVVIDRGDETAFLSFQNLPDVQLILGSELNAYDVLCNDWILFTRSTLPTTTAVAEPAAATEKPAAATEEPEEASDGSA